MTIGIFKSARKNLIKQIPQELFNIALHMGCHQPRKLEELGQRYVKAAPSKIDWDNVELGVAIVETLEKHGNDGPEIVGLALGVPPSVVVGVAVGLYRMTVYWDRHNKQHLYVDHGEPDPNVPRNTEREAA